MSEVMIKEHPGAVEVLGQAQGGDGVSFVQLQHQEIPLKWTWISTRFLPVVDRMIPAHRVRRITCRTAIVRGPRMIMTRNCERLAPRIAPEHAIFAIHNSAWTEDGRPIFSWPDLHQCIDALDWPSKEPCPIGPRREQAFEITGLNWIVRRMSSDYAFRVQTRRR